MSCFDEVAARGASPGGVLGCSRGALLECGRNRVARRCGGVCAAPGCDVLLSTSIRVSDVLDLVGLAGNVELLPCCCSFES